MQASLPKRAARTCMRWTRGESDISQRVCRSSAISRLRLTTLWSRRARTRLNSGCRPSCRSTGLSVYESDAGLSLAGPHALSGAADRLCIGV